MKSIVFSLCFLLCFIGLGQNKMSTNDLQHAIGNWEGTITYLDYQTNKPFTMPANLEVSKGKDAYTLVFKNKYPNEPKANSSSKVKLTKEGSKLNKHTIVSRKKLDNGNLQIQTEHEGKDDRKKALIRYTYLLGEKVLVIIKEVQFTANDKWIKRSEFSYVKKG